MGTDLQAAASAIGRQMDIVTAATIREIDTAFATLVEKRVDGLLVAPTSLLDNRRVQLVTLASHHRIPTLYAFRDHVEAGGLMSYGSSAAERDRQVGIYVGRILKGEKPADQPVVQPTKFEFVINLKTAKALGVDIPPGVRAIADEVIE
jgi:putative ABC transport system substrate-binding protein